MDWRQPLSHPIIIQKGAFIMTWLQLTTLASGLVAGATLLGKLVRLIAAI